MTAMQHMTTRCSAAGPPVRALTEAGYPVAASTLATMFPAAGWRSYLTLCKARIAVLTMCECAFVNTLSWQREPSERQRDWLRAIVMRLREGGR